MSDFMFMLESRLSSEQNAAFNAVTAAAEAENSLFLTGGAVRDLLGHFPIRELDFTVEGSPSKLAKDLVKAAGAVLVAEDSHRKSVDLVFPGNVTVEISMSRSERYGKPGSRPVVAPGDRKSVV